MEKLSRVRILEAIRKRLADVLARPDLEMVALDYFRCLGHDNHRRLSKLYAWEEKKSKTSWGAETVDYEKIATAAVQGMKTADVHRFLAVCALVSDLYCPGYNRTHSIAKDSNLALTATRYKVDAAQVVAKVRAELCNRNVKAKALSKPKASSQHMKGSTPKRRNRAPNTTNERSRPSGDLSFLHALGMRFKAISLTVRTLVRTREGLS